MTAIERTCRNPDCAATFIAKRTNAFYCGKACKDRHKAQQYRERLKSADRSTWPKCHVCGRNARTPVADLCEAHYQRRRMYGDPLAGKPLRGGRLGVAPCAVDGCDRKFYSKGLCQLHYNRQRATGSVGASGLVRPKAKRKRMVDKRGYAMVFAPGRTANGWRLEHRVVMEEHLGRELLPGENVHHVNGVRSDNRLSNLELWSSTQPAGQRAVDKLAWARQIIATYEPIEHLLT